MHELPTPRSMARTLPGACLVQVVPPREGCRSRRTDRRRPRRCPLVQMKWRCGNCGSRLTEFIVGGSHSGRANDEPARTPGHLIEINAGARRCAGTLQTRTPIRCVRAFLPPFQLNPPAIASLCWGFFSPGAASSRPARRVCGQCRRRRERPRTEIPILRATRGFRPVYATGRLFQSFNGTAEAGQVNAGRWRDLAGGGSPDG